MFDGSLSRHMAAYYNRADSLIRQQQQLVQKLFGFGGALREMPNGVKEFRVNSVELVTFLDEVIGKIRQQAYYFPKAWKRMVLRAFFDDEGNVYMSRDHRTRRVRGYQYDLSILQLIQSLLEDFGISSNVRSSFNYVEIKRREELVKFRREVGFSRGLTLNPYRKNSIWKQPLEKRELLNRAIASFRPRSKSYGSNSDSLIS